MGMEAAISSAGRVWAYLRVSTRQQDVAAQRQGIIEWHAQHGGGAVRWVSDSVSGMVSWRQRRLGSLVMEDAQAGDTIVVAEVSRLGRQLLQVLEVADAAEKRGISLVAVKGGVQFRAGGSGKVVATVLGLASEIERELICARTREGLRAARERGTVLGRPKGSQGKLKCDVLAEQLAPLVAAGVASAAIGRLVGLSPGAVRRWRARRGAGGLGR